MGVGLHKTCDILSPLGGQLCFVQGWSLPQASPLYTRVLSYGLGNGCQSPTPLSPEGG